MGGHLRVAREVGSYKAAGYISKTRYFVLFLLVVQAQEKKNQKEKRRKSVSRSAEREEGFAPSTRASL